MSRSLEGEIVSLWAINGGLPGLYDPLTGSHEPLGATWLPYLFKLGSAITFWALDWGGHEAQVFVINHPFYHLNRPIFISTRDKGHIINYGRGGTKESVGGGITKFWYPLLGGITKFQVPHIGVITESLFLGYRFLTFFRVLIPRDTIHATIIPLNIFTAAYVETHFSIPLHPWPFLTSW